MSETVEHIVDLLRRWGPVGVKRMFGGVGLYRGGVMFGLVSDEQVYFKVDEGNAAEYERRGLEPFRYERSGKTVALSYRTVPEEVFDDAEALYAWARAAWEAALRAQTRERRPRPNERLDVPGRGRT